MNTAATTTPTTRTYKYYDFIMVAFVTILLTSNLIGASKICEFKGFTFGAGIFFFPLSYVFGDIMTEVYGYARARKIVWAGFAAMIYATFMSMIETSSKPDFRACAAIIMIPSGWTCVNCVYG